jgi:riboflavin kinase, archaea type
VSDVAGFFEWAVERIRWRLDQKGAYQAEQDRVHTDFLNTSVPMYGLPPSCKCVRGITWGSDAPLRGGLPVGTEATTRFGLIHGKPGGGGLEVDSVVGHGATEVEYMLAHSRWGVDGRQVSIERPYEMMVGDSRRKVRLLLPWEQDSPSNWACAVPVEGCVLKVKAQEYPLSEVTLVRVTDVGLYLQSSLPRQVRDDSGVELRGRVATGIGGHAHWMEVYADLYEAKTGVRLYPGSLNVVLERPWHVRDPSIRLEPPEYAIGLSIVSCTIEGINAFILRTDKNDRGEGDHSPNVVEIAAAVRLRDVLGLEDGDEVGIVVSDQDGN